METVATQSGLQGAGREVFALTDEQILGMEPEGTSGSALTDEQLLEDVGSSTERCAAEDVAEGKATTEDAARRDATGQAKEHGEQAPPRWLAERMRDPWHGDEAKELWEGAVQARQEAAAYRESIASPAEARALKEIYPRGVNEAKSAAERARQLDEFDGAYFGAAGRPTEELRASRVQLAQRLLEQDPAAFREMVAAGVRLLEARGSQQAASGGDEKSGSLAGARDDSTQVERGTGAGKGLSPEGVGYRDGKDRNTSAAAVQEVPAAYVNFEKTANAELEKTVGGAIGRAMQQALPNLQSLDRAGRDGAAQGTPLQERLGAAVREEVEAALKSDAQLSEQVAKILGARRFDDAARAQVVRVIDARAQQLVPGAVKRVVGSWTTATLGASGKTRAAGTGTVSEQTASVVPRSGKSGQSAGCEKAEMRVPGRTANRGRVDYGKLSDEQILEL